MPWLFYGLAVGTVSAFLLVKFLPAALSGTSMVAPIVIGGKLFVQLAALTVPALFGKEALLWAAGGDVAGLAVFFWGHYLRKRKKR